MLIRRVVYPHAHVVFVICVLTGFSTLLVAAPEEETVAEEAQPAFAETPTAIHDLDQGISLEERMQLRRDLVQYSRAVDPSHIKIEEQRRLMRQRIQERFLASDKDNDGGISREEAAETLPQIFRHFSQVDLNDDGVISVSELEAVQARAIERRRAAEAREATARNDSEVLRQKASQTVANGKNDL